MTIIAKKPVFIVFVTGLLLQNLFSQNMPVLENSDFLPCRFICTLDVAVVSKRPDRNPPPNIRFALLNTCASPDEPQQQRRVIQVEWKGKREWRELVAIEKVFEDYAQALDYALLYEVPMAHELENPDKISFVPDRDTQEAVYRYSDGSNNHWLIGSNFVRYKPQKAETSSSGLYDGGEPFRKELSEEVFNQFSQLAEEALKAGENNLQGGRPMQSGLLSKGASRVILAPSLPQKEALEQAIDKLR